MKTLAVIGDIHDHQQRLGRVLDHLRALPALDGVLLVGDIAKNPRWLRRNHPDELARMASNIVEIADQVEQALGAPLRFVPGNHDPRHVPDPRNVDGRLDEVAGLRVFGVGGAGPAAFGLPYEWSEDEVAALPSPVCDVILAHCPPANTPLDALRRNGQHVGSLALLDRARLHRGLYVCGHIHEASGAVVLDECLCVNAGGLGNPFGAARVVTVEVDDRPGSRTWQATLHDLDEGTSRAWSLTHPR